MSSESANISGLPGLESLGQKTADDASARGVALIVPKIDIPEGGYKALEHLPKDVKLETVRNDAKKLVASPELNQLSFLNLVRQFDIDDTATIDSMLQVVKARNAGEAGERVAMIVTKCSDFNKKMPKPNSRFVERFKAGKAAVSEILENVKWLAKQLEKYRAGFNDLLTLVEKEEQYHMDQSNLSVEACARDLVIAKEEDEREDKLVRMAALLECLREELKNALEAGSRSDDDQTRLQNVAMLVTARLKNIYPMIQKANLASKRFAVQSNSNALTALDQYDFATMGIAAWKSDIAAQLDATANINMNMAYLEGVSFTEEQAKTTAAAFDAQMQSMAELLSTQLHSLDTIEVVTQSLVRAGQTMTKAFETAQDQTDAAAKIITKSQSEVKKAQDDMRNEMTRIMGKYQ